jgi:DNA-binding Xre family transcriptional regulator
LNGHGCELFESTVDVSVSNEVNSTVTRGEGYLQAGSKQALREPVPPAQFKKLVVHSGQGTTLICSWCLCSWHSRNEGVIDHAHFFRRLGKRVRELRRKRGHSQEDMISFGFSARHWQQIEAGRPITLTTLLRICEALDVRLTTIVAGLDRAAKG